MCYGAGQGPPDHIHDIAALLLSLITKSMNEVSLVFRRSRAMLSFSVHRS